MNYNKIRSYYQLLSIFIFSILLISIDLIPVNKKIKPEIFEEGIISTNAIETNSAFTQDGLKVYFTRRAGKWGDPENRAKSVIYFSKKTKGKWQIPQIAPFSGKYSDSDLSISPDGTKMFFTSKRPVKKGGPLKKDMDIWMSNKSVNGWNEPVHLGNIINSSGTEYSPISTNNHSLYFASTRAGGMGQGDIYVSRYVDGKYQVPENLGSNINSKTGEWNLFVSADETYIILEASQRKENKTSYGDLYISFFKSKQWTPTVNIVELNTEGSDLMPKVSHDKKYLYYSCSNKITSPNVDIYRVKLSQIIDKYSRK